MRIGIDIDGVLRDLYTQLVDVYLREYPDEWCRPVSEWGNYDISDVFSIGDEIYNFWFRSSCTKEIYQSAKPFPGYGIIHDMATKNEIEIISNQPNDLTTYFTLNWLQGLNLPYNGLHFTKDKFLIDCDIYVEDSPEQILRLRKDNKRVVVVKCPWNDNGQLDDEDLIRVKDFYEFGKNVLKGKY